MTKNLSDWFGEGSIDTNVEVETFQESIVHVGNLLVKSGKARPEYAEAMISVVEEFGPYIVVAESVALAHAAPGVLVSETGLALACLNRKVDFGDGKMVDLVFGLAAVDHEQHLEAMSQLALLLGDEQNVNLLRKSQDSEEVRKILTKGL